MMEENNRKGPGVFYAVMGVATLVVAIIGATFAFFSATADVTGEDVTGTTAEAVGLTVAVAKVNPTSTDLGDKLERLVPLTSTDMEAALRAGCVDSKGYTACQVYSVTITSDADETVIATPTVTLDEDGTFENLNWQLLDGTSTANFALNTAFGAVTDSTEKALGNVTLNATAGKTKTLYFVIWLNNLDDEQNEEAGQTYTGTVAVTAVDALGQSVGGRLQATFTQG